MTDDIFALPPLGIDWDAPSRKVGKDPYALFKQGKCDNCGTALFGREKKERNLCGNCDCPACHEVRKTCSSKSPECRTKKHRNTYPKLRDKK